MKKTLSITILGLILAACSSDNGHRPPHVKMSHNPEFESAMQACHQSSNKDMTAFESCMKAKGFEKPVGTPPQKPQAK